MNLLFISRSRVLYPNTFDDHRTIFYGSYIPSLKFSRQSFTNSQDESETFIVTFSSGTGSSFFFQPLSCFFISSFVSFLHVHVAFRGMGKAVKEASSFISFLIAFYRSAFASLVGPSGFFYTRSD